MKSFMFCSTTKHAQHEPAEITTGNGTKPSKWVGTKVALDKRLWDGYNNHLIVFYVHVPQDNDTPEAVHWDDEIRCLSGYSSENKHEILWIVKVGGEQQ